MTTRTTDFPRNTFGWYGPFKREEYKEAGRELKRMNDIAKRSMALTTPNEFWGVFTPDKSDYYIFPPKTNCLSDSVDSVARNTLENKRPETPPIQQLPNVESNEEIISERIPLSHVTHMSPLDLNLPLIHLKVANGQRATFIFQGDHLINIVTLSNYEKGMPISKTNTVSLQTNPLFILQVGASLLKRSDKYGSREFTLKNILEVTGLLKIDGIIEIILPIITEIFDVSETPIDLNHTMLKLNKRKFIRFAYVRARSLFKKAKKNPKLFFIISRGKMMPRTKSTLEQHMVILKESIKSILYYVNDEDKHYLNKELLKKFKNDYQDLFTDDELPRKG
jgi:hypothetical protein